MPARTLVPMPFAAMLLTSAALAQAPANTPQPPPEPDEAQGPGPLQPATQPPPPEANLTGAPQESKQAEKWWLWGDKRPSEWTVQIEPTVWYMGLGGDLKLGGGTKFDVVDINADDPRVVPAGEVRIRGGDLTFSLSGFGYAGEETAGARNGFTAGGLVVAPGTIVNSDITVTSAEMRVGYKVFVWPSREGGTLPGEPSTQVITPFDAELRLEVYGGVRMLDMRTELTTAAGGFTDDGFVVQPTLGVRLGLEMFERTSVDVAVDYGYWPVGDRTAQGINVAGSLSWRPWGNVGFSLGYRLLDMDMEDGDFEFEGSFAGLFASVVIRF